jgi:ribosome-associated protein
VGTSSLPTVLFYALNPQRISKTHNMAFQPIKLHPELVFQTARSGGKGGQNVNKVETKVELRFDVQNSALLSEAERAVLLEKLANRINNEGVLVLQHQTERSQLDNKAKVLIKFNQLLIKAFEVQKARKKSIIPRGVVEARRENKSRNAEVKRLRQKVKI